MNSNHGFVVGINFEGSLHDRWFRSQVETALKEADDPTTEFIPHETVRSSWADKKKILEACAASSR